MCLQYYYASSCVSVESISRKCPLCKMRATRPLSSTTRKEADLRAWCVVWFQIRGIKTTLTKTVQMCFPLSVLLFILCVCLPGQAEPALLLTPTNGVDGTDGLKQTSLQVLHPLPQPLIHLFEVDIFTDSC